MRTSPTRRPVVPALMALLASAALLLGCATEHGNLPSEPAFGIAADVGRDAFEPQVAVCALCWRAFEVS
jgi:hypothetical protein